MTRLDYSSNAELLEEEIYDYDTVDIHETGINTDRMRLPDRYDIAKFYKRDKEPSSYDKLGNPRYEKGEWVEKKKKDLPKISEDFDWQITYKFPSTLHSNISRIGKVYGGDNVTYRRLYLILCERFNGGSFFVDDYFNSVYPTSWAKEAVDVELNNLKDELLFYAEDLTEGAKFTKSGKLDRRYKANEGMAERLNEWQTYARKWEADKGVELARILKDDIIKACETQNARAYMTVNPRSQNQIKAYISTFRRKFRPNDPRYIHAEEILAGQTKGHWDDRPILFLDIDTTDQNVHKDVSDILTRFNIEELFRYKTPNGGLHIVLPNKNAKYMNDVKYLFNKYDNYRNKGRFATVHPNNDGKIILYSNVDAKGY